MILVNHPLRLAGSVSMLGRTAVLTVVPITVRVQYRADLELASLLQNVQGVQASLHQP